MELRKCAPMQSGNIARAVLKSALLGLVACSGQGSDGDDLDAATNPSTGDGGATLDGGPGAMDGGQGQDGGPEGRVDVEGELVDCPSVVVLVAPAVVRVGESAYLRADATPESAGLRYLWSVSEGKVSDPAAPMTSYRCLSPGEKQIEVFIYRGPCSDSAKTGILCEATP